MAKSVVVVVVFIQSTIVHQVNRRKKCLALCKTVNEIIQASITENASNWAKTKQQNIILKKILQKRRKKNQELCMSKTLRNLRMAVRGNYAKSLQQTTKHSSNDQSNSNAYGHKTTKKSMSINALFSFSLSLCLPISLLSLFLVFFIQLHARCLIVGPNCNLIVLEQP